MSNLRDAINAYSANTGIRATLSADKTNIIIVQDEGEDVVIEDVDFATVTNGNTKFTFTAMSQDQTDEAATQITTVTDTQHGATRIVFVLLVKLHFIHRRHLLYLLLQDKVFMKPRQVQLR